MQTTELALVHDLEVWKDVWGYELLYEVSDRGRVRALFAGNHGQFKPGRILKPDAHSNGYLFVTLWKRDGSHKARSIHSLVLEAFKGPRPEDHQCRHLDGVRTHNFPENLEWGTGSENREDSRRHGTITNGERNGFAKLTAEKVIEIRHLRDGGMACEKIACMFDIDWSNVWLIGKRKTWKHIPETVP